VSWQPPPAHSRNGRITGYKIRYKQRGDGTGSENVVKDGNSRSHEITGKQTSSGLTSTAVLCVMNRTRFTSVLTTRRAARFTS